MKIYNSQTRRKEELIPLTPGEYKIYVCGPTVYNYIHIGNARPFILFDTLRRYLEWRGNKVTYVQNFTDIDDKMINKANDEGSTVKEIADRYIEEYRKDAKALGITPPSHAPRATEHIGDIIRIIKKLEANGYAYAVDGDVYFDTAAYPQYGKLSGQSMEDLMAGARIEVDDKKHAPMDFALWKAEKPGEPSWNSPWGKGRPGWHIECSAMSTKYLGETIDIHCGGKDLLFPHHENEVAQSEGASGKPFVHYWMHNGYINIDNQKMSKSLGNFFTVREIAEKYPLEILRFFLLSAHYRSPVNFSDQQLEQSKAALGRLYTARDNWEYAQKHASQGDLTSEIRLMLQQGKDGFIAAMEDDFNTADAIGCLFEMIKNVNIALDTMNTGDIDAALLLFAELTGVLGIVTEDLMEIPAEILPLINARKIARAQKNWAESDRLRDEIAGLGYSVEDTKDGQKVKKA